MNTQLGQIQHTEFEKKLTTFKDKLEKKKSDDKVLSSKVKSLTELNKKVSDSYNVSLKIIVDVTRLLNQYMVYFNEIESLMDSITNSNAISSNYLSNINALTSKKIEELSENFKNQLDSLKTVYTKNNLDTKELDQYKDLLTSINTESKSLLKQEGGRRKKR